ncbi:hypothetical protein [Nostoc sp.]|uniref:hypothetical protein n=1 Tax=Nostoc sp. TaxID=1180 RepID=UPI003FA58BB0
MFLSDWGAELLEIARFWASFATYNHERDRAQPLVEKRRHQDFQEINYPNKRRRIRKASVCDTLRELGSP